MTIDNSPGFTFSISKDYLILVPLLGSSLAITYDVGYFTGFDLTLFSLFSLSEHIVFALGVFPFALLMAVGVGVAMYLNEPLTKTARSHIASAVTGTVVLIVIISIVVWLSKAYFITAVALIFSVLVVIAFEVESVWIRAVLLYVAATLIAFLLGYESGIRYLYPDSAPRNIFTSSKVITTTIETESGLITVTIMRSGERGVLFFDQNTQHVTLLRWDEIRKISTGRAP